jgi:hypothetical protein
VETLGTQRVVETLHPGDAGYLAMGDAIDLNRFRALNAQDKAALIAFLKTL